jgi:hypothetical protein
MTGGDRGAPAGAPAGRVTAVQQGAVPVRSAALVPGALGVTLALTGIPLAELAPGTRLRAGRAVVELTGEAPDRAAGTLLDADAENAAVAARVVAGGPVAPGDAVDLDAVRVPLEDALDLHPFAPRDIPDVVAEYLVQARAAGLGEVRLIHGRGRGVQREAVRRVLAASPLVLAFADAAPERGGWGATIVRLRLPPGGTPTGR